MEWYCSFADSYSIHSLTSDSAYFIFRTLIDFWITHHHWASWCELFREILGLVVISNDRTCFFICILPMETPVTRDELWPYLPTLDFDWFILRLLSSKFQIRSGLSSRCSSTSLFQKIEVFFSNKWISGIFFLIFSDILTVLAFGSTDCVFFFEVKKPILTRSSIFKRYFNVIVRNKLPRQSQNFFAANTETQFS